MDALQCARAGVFRDFDYLTGVTAITTIQVRNASSSLACGSTRVSVRGHATRVVQSDALGVVAVKGG
jgi:hypothetical protein